MIYKSMTTTFNHHIIDSQIFINNVINSHSYPRVNSQQPVQNRSQTKKMWQSVTTQLVMASSTARLVGDYRSLAMASWIARLAKHYGSLAMASWVAHLASDEGMLAVASYDSRLAKWWQNRVRDYELFHQKSQFLPCLTPNSTETLALRLFYVL